MDGEDKMIMEEKNFSTEMGGDKIGVLAGRKEEFLCREKRNE
jgi:hypothetical protein